MAQIGGVNVPTATAPAATASSKLPLVLLVAGGAYVWYTQQQSKKKDNNPHPPDESAPVDDKHPAGNGTGVGAPPAPTPDYMTECGQYYVDVTKGKISALDPGKLFPTNTPAMNEGWVKEWNGGVATNSSYLRKDGKCVFNVKKGSAGVNTNLSRDPASAPQLAKWTTFKKLTPAGGPQLEDWAKHCACFYDDPSQGPYDKVSASNIVGFGRPGAPTYDRTVSAYRVNGGKCSLIITKDGKDWEFKPGDCTDPNRLKTNVPRDASTDPECACYGKSNVRVRSGVCTLTGGGGIVGPKCK